PPWRHPAVRAAAARGAELIVQTLPRCAPRDRALGAPKKVPVPWREPARGEERDSKEIVPSFFCAPWLGPGLPCFPIAVTGHGGATFPGRARICHFSSVA